MGETSTQALLRRGIALAKAGQTAQARQILSQVVKADPANVQGWLWLTSVVSDPAKKVICLQRVLKLEPDNNSAQAGLAQLKQQPSPAGPSKKQEPVQSGADKSPPPSEKGKRSGPAPYKKLSPVQPPSPKEVPPKPTHIADSASLASVLLKDSFAARRPAPEPISDAPQDLLGDEYQCPFCAAPPETDASTCSQCGRKLWITLPKRATPSRLYRIIRLLQTISFVGDLGYIGLILMSSMGEEALPSSFSIFLAGCIFPYFLIRAVVLIGLYRRWRTIFYLFLVAAMLMLGYTALAIYGLAYLFGLDSVPTVVCGGGLLFMALAQLFIALSLGDDFTFNKYRILLKVDTDVKTGVNLLDRGRHYAARQMWAKAAVHFRRAAYQRSSDAEAHLSLAVAYINLKMYDQAREPLQQAKQLDPFNAKIKKLEGKLAEQHR